MQRALVLASFVLASVACAAKPSSTAPTTAQPAIPGLVLPAGVPYLPFGKVDVTFSSATSIKSRTLALELASTPEQQERGLMYRTRLLPNGGMLFLNDTLSQGAFWMKNTLIPLDIVFFDRDGRINDFFAMQPCKADPCTVYQPNTPYIGAIEMSLGWFAKAGFKVGDKVTFKPVQTASSVFKSAR